MRRGFLPRGLLDTCPPLGHARGLGVSPGQVSNKPKRLQSAIVAQSIHALVRKTVIEIAPISWRIRELSEQIHCDIDSACEQNL